MISRFSKDTQLYRISKMDGNTNVAFFSPVITLPDAMIYRHNEILFVK